MKIMQIVKLVEKIAIDNSPLILTGIGVAGTLSTALLTGKATFKAAEILEEERKERNQSVGFGIRNDVDFPIREQIRAVWPLYIPAAGTAALTITCIIVANRIGTRRAAAIAAAYTVSEKAFEEYREKIIEKLGANKERAARDELSQDRMDRNPASKNEVVITGGGDVLCYETYTGRYFRSSMEDIKKAQNDLNYRIINSTYASLNDFYDLLGLDHVSIGEEVGWSSDKLLDIYYSTTISDDQKPAISIEFRVQPVRDYFRLH